MGSSCLTAKRLLLMGSWKREEWGEVLTFRGCAQNVNFVYRIEFSATQIRLAVVIVIIIIILHSIVQRHFDWRLWFEYTIFPRVAYACWWVCVSAKSVWWQLRRKLFFSVSLLFVCFKFNPWRILPQIRNWNEKRINVSPRERRIPNWIACKRVALLMAEIKIFMWAFCRIYYVRVANKSWFE